MKKALIEGTRIAQVVANGNEFDIGGDLFWVDVPDDTTERDTYQNSAVVKHMTYVPSMTVEEAQSRKRALLSQTFQMNRDAGTLVLIGGTTVTMATNHNAQQELREVVSRLAGGGTQKGVTRSGAPVVFTEAIAQQCLDAVNDHHGACNDNEYDHLIAMLALISIADIDAYDVTTGWPETS